jgi:hypothetical protein
MGFWSDQLRGFGRGVRETVERVKPGDVIPPSIWGTIDWFINLFPRAVGIKGDAQDQIYASIALIAVSILSSVVTGGLTIAAVAIFSFTLLVGFARLFPYTDKLVRSLRAAPARVWDTLYRIFVEWDL